MNSDSGMTIEWKCLVRQRDDSIAKRHINGHKSAADRKISRDEMHCEKTTVTPTKQHLLRPRDSSEGTRLDFRSNPGTAHP